MSHAPSVCCANCVCYKVTGKLEDQCSVCIALYCEHGIDWGKGWCCEYEARK